MTYVVQINKLTKTIGEKNLVTNVSMHVKKGEIYGFLGPNGAGKTTVMKLLTNLWKPTEGSIELFGEKLTSTSYDVLKRMGCMIEFPTFYEHLSGRENLALHCEYMGYYNTGSIVISHGAVRLEQYREKISTRVFSGNETVIRTCTSGVV